MLELKNITKEYRTGAEIVHALRGVDLAFRESEFVAILGPSGCGKTTMLNILGGLDQYTSGDLVIDGISTKEYKDADWDAYRNDTIGFVFQSYNLISHQTVLANVELALTLSGVSAADRRKRAIAALEQVGLGDQITKKPAQMSGGQVQRVAIARALINDPDIILADEPTGALDSETSLQIMSILKDISTRKLVIMVTHNPELAETYATRIVRLSDGQVISDSMPFDPQMETAAPVLAAAGLAAVPGLDASTDLAQEEEALANKPSVQSRRARRRRNKSMSMRTALQLSLNNLMTKKARTLLTAFAGSIGIIGIALILSVSNGFQTYIDKLEEDTLSSYPLQIQSETADMTSMITAFAANAQDTEGENAGDKIHEQQVMTDMLASIGSNDLAAFKEYLDSNMVEIKGWFNDYSYNYGISPTIYSLDLSHGVLRVSPGSIMQSYMNGMQTSMVSYANTDVFFQMMNNQELLESQYKVLAGKWPQKYDELLLVLDSEDQLNDYIVYTLGLRDPQELKDMINEVMKGNEVESHEDQLEWTYDDFIGMEFALVNNCDTYRHNDEYNVWESMSDDEDFMKDLIKKSERLHITGIVCAKDKSGASAMNSGIGYLPSLTQHMIDYAKESDIVRIQKAKKGTDVFSGKTFESIRNKTDEGLGFGDMISIDEDKLKKAFGGNINPKAIEKSIRKTGDDELKSLVAQDSAEKIQEDVTKTLKKKCGSMVDYIVEEFAKDPANFKIDDDLINEDLAANTDTGKHAAIINQLLAGYGKVLKEAGKQLEAAMASGMMPGTADTGESTQDTSSKDTSSKDASQESADTADNDQAAASSGEGSEEKSADTSGETQAAAPDPAEQITAYLASKGINVSKEQASMLIASGASKEDIQKYIPGLSEEEAQMLSDQIKAAASQEQQAEQPAEQEESEEPSQDDSSQEQAQDESSQNEQEAQSEEQTQEQTPVIPQTSPEDMLLEALNQTIDPFINAKELQSGIKQYSEGIEMMQMAKEVYPALGKVAADVGGQFKVDPDGIADAFQMKMDEDELTRLITAYMSGDAESSYEANMRELGYAEVSNPASMSFYFKDFDSKQNFLNFIDSYNSDMQDQGKEDLVISYTDITGVMMKSVKTITNAVSYVLIAFVAISLIVSSIMIGVITYISVLERTKEIGILRAIGASKKDISRIFNAETIIVGLCAGVIGIGASLLLLIPINKILIGLTGIQSLKAILPAAGGVILILISIFLTFIAGLIPSGMAARKDPVVALRTE